MAQQVPAPYGGADAARGAGLGPVLRAGTDGEASTRGCGRA